MPRIYDSFNDAHDFCMWCHFKHFPNEAAARAVFGNVGDGPDGRGNCFAYEADHPEYADDPRYKCESCSEQLTEEDS